MDGGFDEYEYWKDNETENAEEVEDESDAEGEADGNDK